jgi:hypothetical protein
MRWAWYANGYWSGINKSFKFSVPLPTAFIGVRLNIKSIVICQGLQQLTITGDLIDNKFSVSNITDGSVSGETTSRPTSNGTPSE